LRAGWSASRWSSGPGAGARSGSPRGFGLIDLYQAVAGSVGLFPAARFAYQPLDDVLHVTLGLGLVGLGALGWGRGAAEGPAGGDPARGGPGIGVI
jgi:hypothetical protein